MYFKQFIANVEAEGELEFIALCFSVGVGESLVLIKCPVILSAISISSVETFPNPSIFSSSFDFVITLKRSHFSYFVSSVVNFITYRLLLFCWPRCHGEVLPSFITKIRLSGWLGSN